MYDEKLPRHVWRLGKVESVIPGGDGCVRGAEVRLGKTGNTIRRPVSKLYPIVIADNDYATPVENILPTKHLRAPLADTSTLKHDTDGSISSDQGLRNNTSKDSVSTLRPTSDNVTDISVKSTMKNDRPKRMAAVRGEQLRKLTKK